MKQIQNNSDLLRNYSTSFKAAVSISFDFETSAQTATPIYRTKLKSRFYKATNLLGLTNKDLSMGYGRGYGNRIGAEKILKILNQYKIKATWFSTGHVLMKENQNRQAFRINQILTYANAEAGFTAATTWRAQKKSFYHEPFSNYKKQPYYYLGDLAENIKIKGHDIQCHSFSHPYVSMEPRENIKNDLEDWQQLAEKEGFAKSNIFAFPFLGDYHFIDRMNGNKTIPAFKKPGKAYEISFLDEKVLKIFKNAGIELFTRCGSMCDSDLFKGFIPYQNSEIYCMKDIGIFSFINRLAFKIFIEEVIRKNASIDLWLHPNDIMDSDKYELFKLFIDELVQYRDKDKIWLCTIDEQWRKFKENNKNEVLIS